MSGVALAVMDASRIAMMQRTSPSVPWMNPRDYAELQDTFEYSEAEDIIRAVCATHHARTTRLGQLAVARRLSARRGRRFHALQWEPRS